MNDPSILQFQQMLNEVPDPLFTQLYPNYTASKYYRPLIQELLNTLQAYRDIPCQYGFRSKLPETSSLLDIICLMSSLYNPVPLTPEQLHDNSQFVNGASISNGANGDIYSTNASIITKVSKQNNAPELLRETFFNYRIVNEFILRGISILVETYGFFFCDKPSINLSQPICNPDVQGTGYPWLNLVQKKIVNSITLRKALQLRNIGGQIQDEYGQTNPLYDNIGVLSLEQVQLLVSIIFSILIIMQESPYQVNHNDLHPGNILILDDGTIKLIDWGLVSFTFQGTRYKSFLDTRYAGADILNSGASDAFFLFNIIYAESPVHEIKEWARDCLYVLFRNRLLIKRQHFLSIYDMYIYKNPIQINPWLLITLNQEEDSYCYNHNLTVLNTLTYSSICNQLVDNGIVIYDYPLTAKSAPFPEPVEEPIVESVNLGKKPRASKNKKRKSRKNRL